MPSTACGRYMERESFPAEARFIQLLSQNLNNSAKIRLSQCYPIQTTWHQRDESFQHM